MNQNPGKRLGKYLLTARLGQGGMGVVFAGVDERLKREVAIKVLPKAVAADEAAVKRFLQEARAAARIHHPNVVSVFDVDRRDGYCFLVMELLPGGSAADVARAGTLDWRGATRLVADACRGLVVAHAAGLVHRDIKPSNLLIAADGSAKLADFGLVKVAGSTQQSITKTGSVMGTPQFMSPEQCQGEELDARSDLYSLGGTYYALLTGRAPFDDLDPLATMFAHCSRSPDDPRVFRPEIPDACVAVVQRAMGRARHERFSSAAEMLAALTAILEPAPPLAPGESRAGMPSAAKPGPQSPPSRPMPPSSVLPAMLPTQTGLPAATSPLPTIVVEIRPPSAAAALRIPAANRRRLRMAAIATGLLLVLLLVSIPFWPDPDSPSGVGNGTRPPAAAHRDFPWPCTLVEHWEVPEFDGGMVNDACFSPDGRRVFMAGFDGKIREWSVPERRIGRTFHPTGDPQEMLAIAVSPDGRWLLGGNLNQTIYVWRLADGELHQRLPCDSRVNDLAFRPDGKQLAAACDNKLLLFDVSAEKISPPRILSEEYKKPVGGYITKSVSYSADGRWLAATMEEDHTIAVWDAESERLVAYRQKLPALPATIVFSPDSTAVAVGLYEYQSPDEGIWWWQFEPNSEPRRLQYSAGGTFSVFVAPGGNGLIAAGGWGQPIWTIDLAGQTPNTKFEDSRKGQINVVALSPRELLLITAGGNENPPRGYLKFWKIVPRD